MSRGGGDGAVWRVPEETQSQPGTADKVRSKAVSVCAREILMKHLHVLPC